MFLRFLSTDSIGHRSGSGGGAPCPDEAERRDGLVVADGLVRAMKVVLGLERRGPRSAAQDGIRSFYDDSIVLCVLLLNLIQRNTGE